MKLLVVLLTTSRVNLTVEGSGMLTFVIGCTFFATVIRYLSGPGPT